MQIPKEIQGQPWSDILWKDVLQYAQQIDSHLTLPDNPTILDVGGNIGAAALLFHLRYNAQVISLEAIQETHSTLQKNCSSFPRITPIHTAVGEKQETKTFFRYPLAPGLGGLDSTRKHIWYVLCRQAVADLPLKKTTDIVLLPFRFLGIVLWAFLRL